MRPVAWLSALLLASTVALAGCGGEDDSAASTFSVGALDPDFLTPGRTTGAFDQIHALFTPLTKVDRDNKVVNQMAESITSDDRRTWTIEIRQGWTFHDKTPVTAHSFVDAWNHTAYAPNGWANNGDLSVVEGWDALNTTEGKPKTKEMSGAKVVDEHTIEVTLVRPDSQFPLLLTKMGFYPLPEVAFEDIDAYEKSPIGNGPYRMVGDWVHNRSITVERFAAYQDKRPKTDRIEFKIYSDIKTGYTDVQAGNLDIVNVGQDQYGRAKKDFPDSFTAFDAPAIDYLGFPLFDERYADERLRQAISLAIDREAINKALFADVMTPATSLVASASIGAEKNTCAYCRFDPAEARKLFAAAGGWSGQLTIWYPSGAGYDAMFEAIANQLRENLGITDIALKTQTFPQFLQNLRKQKLHGILRGHWGATHPSMQDTLSNLFTKGGGTYHSTNFTDDEVLDLIHEGDRALSVEAAVPSYLKAEKRILEDFPTVPLFGAKYVYVHSDRVENVVIDVNQIELADVTVAE